MTATPRGLRTASRSRSSGPLSSGWKIYVMSASGAGERQLRQAPPAGRPTWTSRGLLIPTNGDLAKIDPRTGHVQKLFGALIDASVGMDTTAISPDLSTISFVAPDGWIPTTMAAARACPVRPSRSSSSISVRTRRRESSCSTADPPRSRPTGSSSRSWTRTNSCSGCSRTARRRRSRPGSSRRRRPPLRSGSRAELSRRRASRRQVTKKTLLDLGLPAGGSDRQRKRPAVGEIQEHSLLPVLRELDGEAGALGPARE